MKSLGESEWHTIDVQCPLPIFQVSACCACFPVVAAGGLDRSFCGGYRDRVSLTSRLS